MNYIIEPQESIEFIESLSDSAVLSDKFVSKIIGYFLTVSQHKDWTRDEFMEWIEPIHNDLSRTILFQEWFRTRICTLLEKTHQFNIDNPISK